MHNFKLYWNTSTQKDFYKCQWIISINKIFMNVFEIAVKFILFGKKEYIICCLLAIFGFRSFPAH